MPLTLIQGSFRILGAAPDGDSVRFYPQRPHEWNLIRGHRPVRANQAGGAQLRLEGVDALETHYTPEGGVLGPLHQPLDAARQAAEALLRFLGFRGVTRAEGEVVRAAEPDRVEGFILSRFADSHGRCVAFAFKGQPAAPSASSVYLDVADLRQSANYHLIEQGFAYPTYYSKLFTDLRKEITRASRTARHANRGIWSKDLGHDGLKIDSVAQLEKEGYLLPKLFRRLADYFALGDGNASLEGFREYLESRGDRLLVVSEGHFTGFDNVIEVSGQTVRLSKDPEDLVFQEN